MSKKHPCKRGLLQKRRSVLQLHVEVLIHIAGAQPADLGEFSEQSLSDVLDLVVSVQALDVMVDHFLPAHRARKASAGGEL